VRPCSVTCGQPCFTSLIVGQLHPVKPRMWATIQIKLSVAPHNSLHHLCTMHRLFFVEHGRNTLGMLQERQLARVFVWAAYLAAAALNVGDVG
jgi:hypothetical protein